MKGFGHKTVFLITIFLTVAGLVCPAQRTVNEVRADVFGESLVYKFATPLIVDQNHPDNAAEIREYTSRMDQLNLDNLVADLKSFKERLHLDDWLYYQIIRRISDQLAPKSEDYILYTLFKWHLLSLSGYDAILTYANGRILFYVLSDENIYNIPLRREDGKNYVCLNYHDYGQIDFKANHFEKLNLQRTNASRSFSYKVNSIPELKNETREKELNFVYNNSEYRFRIKLNPVIATYFKNYPSTDYEKHFNIPLSREAYNSLIPALKKYTKKLSEKDGVDFLMRFTRYSFLYTPDADKYGLEKRYSPELTLLNESSDCEDRVSLFYYLVKEIYDLPMIVVVYPKHVSIAVHFDRSFGKTIEYNGKKFTICDPTPQERDLSIGESAPALKSTPYQIAFAYEPALNPRK